MHKPEKSRFIKLAIPKRRIFLKTEYDAEEICVCSSLVSSPSSLHLSINRPNGKWEIVAVSIDVTVNVVETVERFEFSQSRSMSPSHEWILRLEAYADIVATRTTYVRVVIGCDDGLSFPAPVLIPASLRKAPRALLYEIRSCSITVVDRNIRSVHRESRELLSLHSPFFSNLFYGDAEDGEVDLAEIRAESREFFDVCSAFGSLMKAMHGRYDYVVGARVFSLATRFGMDRIKCHLARQIRAAPYNILSTFLNYAEWMREADRARDDELVDNLLSKTKFPKDLLQLYETIHESVSPKTLMKITRKLHNRLEKATANTIIAQPLSHRPINLAKPDVTPRRVYHYYCNRI
ncbi:hypothetical protein PFISCL1PPCAC_21075 [Pristionchus fissidentatus]|uniref:BTB domain-containing protein n=1 Tax=Pristionchus fissidentatus TaxID=1538716 RepID=A0AAV5WE64_9BILA|nr:hypothetical protein PFISCL1PPCAC_21075 [Pristionchus fissidentatus]